MKADVPQEDIEFSLSYDPHWLAILKNTDHFTRTDQTVFFFFLFIKLKSGNNFQQVFMPSKKSANERWDFRPSEDDIENIRVREMYSNASRI